VVDTAIPKPGAPVKIGVAVDGEQVIDPTGIDLGSAGSLHDFDRRPFKFDGKNDKVHVELK
jgi:hypothetical protein